MSKIVKILFLGDIFGEPGRRAIVELVPGLREELQLDAVFANCENAAHGNGISTRMVQEVLDAGVDFMTSGNHIYDVHEIYNYLNQPDCKILRPHNYPQSAPGRGTGIFTTKSGVHIGLINIQGNVFMNPPAGLPLDAFDDAYVNLQSEADVIVVDMHAETTSEKRAMGWYTVGKAQLVVGTHTHVPTADEEILDGQTAYITDLGMTGPYRSIIGNDKDLILKKLKSGTRQKFQPGTDDVRLCGVYCEIDVYAKKAIKIERICKRLT